MDTFKAMLCDFLARSREVEGTEMPYLLQCEVKFLRATLADIDRRMRLDCNGY